MVKIRVANNTIPNVAPTILSQNVFTNYTANHSFYVVANATDTNGGTDIISTSISTTTGACQLHSNSTGGNNFGVRYNCTGSALTATSISIGFKDSAANTVNTSSSSNTYPNQAPTVTPISPADNDHNNINLTAQFTPEDSDSDTLTCWLFVNGSINTTSTSVNLSATNTMKSPSLGPDGSFSWNVTCGDSKQNVSTATRTYIFDTITPIITWRKPLSTNASIANTTNYIYDISCSDANLYRMNLTVTNSSGNIIYNQFNDSVALSDANISQTINLSNQTNMQNLTFEMSCTDDHTNGKLSNDYESGVINNADIKFNDKKSQLTISTEDKPAKLNVTLIKGTKEDKFTYSFIKESPKAKFRVLLSSNEEIIYRTPISKIPVHFVWGNYYTDFSDAIDAGFTIEITKINKTAYYLDITKQNWIDGERIVIDPVTGGLNTRTEYAILRYEIPVPPTILSQNVFTNYTANHSFYVVANATDTNGGTDIISTSISTTTGACQLHSNSTGGNNFGVRYNCTGSALTVTSISIGFKDSAANTVNTTGSSNTYPNQAPTILGQNAFTNYTAGHSFYVIANATDTDSSSDFESTSITTSSGICQLTSNSTNGNNFGVKYNCTGTALTATSITIGFKDAGGNITNTTSSSNTYPNQAPTILGQNAFINYTAGHSFYVTANVTDLDMGADIVSTSFTVSSGACQLHSNSTAGTSFGVKYNCTGTVLTATSITIGFKDAGGNITNTTSSSNTYPNQAPTMITATLNTYTPILSDTLLCTSTASDSDEDALTFEYQWYVNSSIINYTYSNITLLNYSVGTELICGVRVNDTWALSSYLNSTPAIIRGNITAVSCVDEGTSSIIYLYYFAVAILIAIMCFGMLTKDDIIMSIGGMLGLVIGVALVIDGFSGCHNNYLTLAIGTVLIGLSGYIMVAVNVDKIEEMF